MSQANFGNRESPLSGTALINTYLEPAFDAILSNHSGNSRPSYAQPGGTWVNTATNPWILNMFDGAQDIGIGEIDVSANTFKPYGVSQAASGITYDNSATALTATNVQAAITEVRSLWLKSKGANVASAATTDIGAAASDFISITGTTTITSLGTGPKYNHVWTQFDGILTLTHNAASLILPRGVNIVTAPGDIAEWGRISGGNWKLLSYQRASGLPLAFVDEDDMTSNSDVLVPSQQSVKAYVDARAPGLILLATATANNSAAIDFLSVITAAYDDYFLDYSDVVLSGGAHLFLRTSSNNGSAFDSGASDYAYSQSAFLVGGGNSNAGSNGAAYIDLVANNLTTDFGTGKTMAGDALLLGLNNTADFKLGFMRHAGFDGGRLSQMTGSFSRLSASAINAVRILASTGNIVSGKFKLYGVKKS